MQPASSLIARSADPPARGQAAQPALVVRETVRQLLLSSAAYHELDADKRLEIAQALVRVCDTAASLIAEETRASRTIEASPSEDAALRQPRAGGARTLATAQSAGDQFSGVSAAKVAGTTRAILNAVSFPRFVTELINGVFKAMVDSNQQQMHAYVDLIKNVAASTDGFADANMAPDRARQWLVETFPGSFTLDGGPDEDTDPRDAAEEAEDIRLRLKPGGSMPTEPALRTALGIAPGESVPSGDPETTLVPFARRALARQRQQMLASMVMLGMQRIVIESGRLNAAMRFHIDTRSAANSEDASRFDFENKSSAAGSFGVGLWSLDAKMTNTIGYVSTQKNQSSEEMNTDLDLNSSVELYFKTDYLPLDRLAGAGQVDRIKVNTLNPDAEATAARTAREARVTDARKAESSRSSELDGSLKRPASPPLEVAIPARSKPANQEAAKKEDATKPKGGKEEAAPKGGNEPVKGTPATDAAKVPNQPPPLGHAAAKGGAKGASRK